jgi:hypothetical protein
LRGQLSSLRASARRALTTASVSVASKPSAKRPAESRRAKTTSSVGVSRRGSGAAAGSRHQHPATTDEPRPRQARESSPPPPPPPPSSQPPTSRASRAELATRLSSVRRDKQFGLSGSRGVASPASSSSGSSSSSGGGGDSGRGSSPGTPHGTMSMSRRSAGLNRSVSSEPLPSQTAYERYERLKHLYVSKYR